MPEKKSGLIEILKGVFKIKKPYCEDIVCQAERVISDYISRRRCEIISKYNGKRHRLMNVIIFLSSGALLYFVYRLLK